MKCDVCCATAVRWSFTKTFLRLHWIELFARFTIGNGKIAPGRALSEMNLDGIRCLNLADLQPSAAVVYRARNLAHPVRRQFFVLRLLDNWKVLIQPSPTTVRSETQPANPCSQLSVSCDKTDSLLSVCRARSR